MSEVDKELSGHYRAAARDEPPAHVDAAILAAAKRAVGSQPQAAGKPPFLRRWYLPVSLAAVVMLSVIVTLRVEHERPEIAMPDSVPVVREEVRKLAQAPEKSAAVPAPASPQEPARMEMPRENSLRSADAARGLAAEGRVANEKIAETPAVPAASQTPRAQEQSAAPAFVPDPPPAPKPAARQAPESAAEIAGAGTLAKRELAPAEWLERIAELRSQQRDREADEQFAEFKRRYPDYRIPEAMTERIAPRK